MGRWLNVSMVGTFSRSVPTIDPPCPNARRGAPGGATTPPLVLLHTPEHKSTWNYSYTNTLPPILTLPAACTKKESYKPHSLLDWNCKSDGSKKEPKVRKHGVAVFGPARVALCCHVLRGRVGVCLCNMCFVAHAVR